MFMQLFQVLATAGTPTTESFFAGLSKHSFVTQSIVIAVMGLITVFLILLLFYVCVRLIARIPDKEERGEEAVESLPVLASEEVVEDISAGNVTGEELELVSVIASCCVQRERKASTVRVVRVRRLN